MCAPCQVVVIVGQPFDTIKVRQQVLQQRAFVSIQQCLRSEGLLGLWKGTSPQIPGSAVQHAVRMGSYGLAKEALLEVVHPCLYLYLPLAWRTWRVMVFEDLVCVIGCS